MKVSRRLQIVGLFIFSILVLSMAFGVSAQDDEDRTFTIALGISVRDLEPTTMTGLVANMMDYVIQPLVMTNADGDFLPGLAESWDISEDGRTVTFNLRQGVTFHDGTPFNADAMAFSLNRWFDENVRAPNPFNNQLMASIDVIDENTIAVTSEFSAQLLLANFVFTGYSAISPDSVDNFGNVSGEGGSYINPIGTGPYVLSDLSPEGMTLTRYEDYWGGAPYYDTVEFLFVPEAATRESLLLAGQADMALLPPVSDLPDLEANEDVQVLIAPSGRVVYAAINTQDVDGIFTDVRVRQALNYAVDSAAIADSLLYGAATPLTSPVAAQNFGHCDVGGYDYDPDRARELLDEAGVGEITINFSSPTGRFLQDFQVAEAIGLYLGQVGITAEPTTSDYGAYVGSLFVPAEAQTLDLHILGFAPPAADAALGMFFINHASQASPRGLNTAYYNNEEASALIDQAFREIDPDVRADLLCQAQTIIWNDAPWIYLHEQLFPIVYRTGIEGVTYRVGEKFDTIYAYPSGE